MPRVRILPYRPERFEYDGTPKPPVTPFEALIECAPFAEPEPSVLEKTPRLDLVDAAVYDVLDERERWVIQALFWRRMTLRELGRELALSKTQVARIRDGAMEKLAVALVHLVDGMDA